jgi:hypothetical protein
MAPVFPGVVDENLTHQLRGDPKKCERSSQSGKFLGDETKIGFVDQCRLVGALPQSVLDGRYASAT